MNYIHHVEKKSRVLALGNAVKIVIGMFPIRVIGILLLSIISGSIPALNLVLLKNIIDSIMHQSSETVLNIYFIFTASFWAILLILQYILPSIIIYLNETTANLVIKKISKTVTNKSLSFNGLAPFENEKYHDLAGWMNYIDAPTSTFIYELSDIITYCIQFISVFVIFAAFKIWIPILLVVSLIPGIFSMLRNSTEKSKQQDVFVKYERQSSYYRGVLVSASSAKELRLFTLKNLIQKKCESIFENITKNKNELSKKVLLSDIATTLSRIAAGIIVFLVVLNDSKNNHITTGSVMMYFQGIFQFSQSLMQIITLWGYTRICSDFFARYFEFMRLEDSIEIAKSKRKITQTAISLKFENVTFKYPSGKVALKNISFELKQGEKIALVGENGAGKTTIIKLIARFYDPTEGQILLNDIDIREYDIHEYRNVISAIFQDFGKYELTAKENILGDQSDTKINTILSSLDEKYFNGIPIDENAMLGTLFGGRDLSGGQWHRLAIARGIIKASEIMLADEPTASIDPIEESRIIEMITSQKRSIMLIATHRLGSIKKMTKIIALRNGYIDGIGTHANLIESCEYYKKLYNSQADLYHK